MEKIAFYFRKNVLAQGDFSLYYRFANYFSEHFNCSVYCINNSFPELQAKYLKTKIRFCEINDDYKKELEGAIFVAAFNQLFFLLEEIKDIKDAKVVLLFLHPQIIPWFISQIRPKRFDIKELFRILNETDAYGFMDKSNLLAVKQYTDENFKERYFPVTIESLDEYKNLPYVEENAYNLGWFGRMDKDKIFSVKNFLDNMAEAEKSKLLKFHFVGDGNAKNEIKAENYFPDMLFYFTSYLYGERCRTYLKNNTDLVLAMGISALDVASLGIPTVIPIVSPVKFREDKYVYIFDIDNFSLGWNKEDLKELNFRTHSAEEILNDIYNLNRKNEIGEKCYKFVKENFSVKKSAESVYKLILSSRLKAETLLKFKPIKNQLKNYASYKKFYNKGDYNSYIIFLNKIKKFQSKSFYGKIEMVCKWIKRKIQKKRNNKIICR